MNKKDMERFHQNRQLIHSTYVYLACFALECQNARNNMRYAKPEDLDGKYRDILADYFGNLERDGQLQEDLNKAYDNILHALKEEFPNLSRREQLVFSYYAVGLPVPLIHALADLSNHQSASVTKTQLKRRIKASASLRREEYLLMLEREKLPNWVRNAIFA